MEALVSSISEFLAAIIARFGYVGRPRRRTNIRDELKLLDEIRSSQAFGVESESAHHLSSHISNEIARYSGVVRKRKVPWGTVIISAIIGLPALYLTFTLVQDGFVWYSIFPGLVAAFFVIGGLGVLFTGDDSEQPEASPK